jgi:hypothetical protein
VGAHRCMICDDKLACRAIDEELEKGMTGAALSRLMTLRGFEVTAPTVLQHAKHRQPMAPPGVAKTKKDLATLVRDRVLQKIENDKFDILDKEIQPALKTGLMAEGLLDKREARTDDKKQVIQLAVLLAGGAAGLVAPPELTDGGEPDDEVFEGEAVRLDDV